MNVTYADIAAAWERIAPYLPPTALEYAPDLGKNVHLKLENTNRTHSFKIRGALNAVLLLSEVQQARGIITASSGNHAQAISYVGHLLGVPATVLMPKHTPLKKVNGAKRWGAAVLLVGENYDETEAYAHQMEREQGMTFISPYNDARVIAGAGTIGIEIAAQLSSVQQVIVCVGGGGLVSGIGLAIKHLLPGCRVIGVNAQSAPAMFNHRHGTQHPEQWTTLAEALSGAIEQDSLTLTISDRVVDAMLMVTEAQIADAMRYMLDTQGWLVEGGGAVGVAAWLAGLLPHDETPTAIIISGANVDSGTLFNAVNRDYFPLNSEK